MSMSLEDWARNRWLWPHKVNRKQISGMLDIVTRDLKEAERDTRNRCNSQGRSDRRCHPHCNGELQNAKIQAARLRSGIGKFVHRSIQSSPFANNLGCFLVLS